MTSPNIAYRSVPDCGQLVAGLVEAAVQNNDRGDAAAQQQPEESQHEAAELVVVAAEAVVEARAAPVQGEAEVVPVDDDLGVPQLRRVEQLPPRGEVGGESADSHPVMMGILSAIITPAAADIFMS